MSSPAQAINAPARLQYMLPTDVSYAFRNRGWKPRAGGDLYFDGLGGTNHPHLHLRLSSQSLVRIDGDIRMAVKMLAWSDGGQGRGGGGITFIRDGDVIRQQWQAHMQNARMNASMAEEFAYIMDYFTAG